ncbi:MAG: hydantoinase B/oxoprolinase family protein [Burkholderiales bacterium]|nr:hydantoinase B/oxoprolinase family protein [Burkholderiales bacterium]
MKRSALHAIQRQVMWNRLISVVEEQAQTLVRTAFGPPTREAGDLSAGVFLPNGDMVAQAVTGTPGHVNSMAEAVRQFLAAIPAAAMRAGDVYVTNDPWKGTGHLNDFTVVTPAFHRKRLVALFACTVHVVDIGGIGFGPDGHQVYHEGLYVPIMRLADRGSMNESLLAIVRANVREPIQVEGDLYALAACNEIGCRRLSAMLDEYGLRDIDELGADIIERSRRAMLAAIAAWPAGTYRNTLDTDGYERTVRLEARLTIAKSGIDIDFTGTSGVSAYGINVPKSYTDAYTSFGVRCIIGANIPNNAGSLSVVRVHAPEGSILNAPFPLAVAARSIIGQMLPDVVFGCLAQARPESVPAEGASSLWNVRLAGGQAFKAIDAAEVAGKTRFNIVSFNTGGTGARPGKDGLSVTSFPSGIRNVSMEILESISPVLFWRKEYRTDSGGAGRWRGGLGQVMEFENGEDAPMVLGATFDRIDNPARGTSGGLGGAPGRVRIASGRELSGKGRQVVPRGERLIVETPGGGGIGEPHARARELVRRDLDDGLISESAACALYGWTA